MSFKRVCLFLIFEVIVTIPIALMIYWLLSLHTGNFQGESMRVYLHGIVMMFAFTYLVAQGVALLRVCPGSQGCAKVTHSVFNTLSLLFGIAGLILIISYKSKNNKSHLYSLHSWCGLLLLSILTVQFVGGSIVLQSCCKGASLKSRLNYVPNHVAMGIAVLLLSAVCVVSGVVNLKEYIGLGKFTERGLDFENSLLNLIAVSATLVFVLLLCVGVSRRARRNGSAAANNLPGGKRNFRDGNFSTTTGDRGTAYRNESKSSGKSKPVSVDTAYSSGPGSAHRHSQRSNSRRDHQQQPGDPPRREPEPQHPRREPEPQHPRREPEPQHPRREPEPQHPRREPEPQQPRREPEPQHPRREPEPQHPRRDPEPQHPRRGSSDHVPRDSVHRDGGLHSPTGGRSSEGADPMSPGRLSFRSQRSQREFENRPHEQQVTSPGSVRSPTSRPGEMLPPRQPSSPPGGYPGTQVSYSRSPPPVQPPAEPRQQQGYHRSGSVSQPEPLYKPDHSYQIPYQDPADVSRDSLRDVPRDSSRVPGYHGNLQNSDNTSPDIPPLFDSNVSHLRASRRGVPPPLELPLSPPVQFAPVNVVNPFPAHYGGQVNEEEEPKQTHMYNPQQQHPPPPDRYTPNHPDIQQQYPPQQQAYYPHSQPVYNPQPPAPYSPQQQPTTFNTRPPSRQQVAKQHRYEVRRAKVEQANMELQRPLTPPAGSYTESLAPTRICTSPVQLSPPDSIPDVDSSILSEDVDGPAPRRGRTSYRNAVKDDDPPPPVPPPPQQFEMYRAGASEDEQGICWL